MSISLIDELKEKLKGKDKAIVLPEGEEPRILEAAQRTKQEGIIKLILLGNEEKIREVAKEKGFDIEGIEIRNPEKDPKFDEYVEKFV